MKWSNLKLRPCPFCGGEAEMLPWKMTDSVDAILVRCTVCLARKIEVTRFKRQAQAAWNNQANLLIDRIVKLEGALTLIAAPKRSDGTYNRCREACEQLARKALEK